MKILEYSLSNIRSTVTLFTLTNCQNKQYNARKTSVQVATSLRDTIQGYQ